jgi:hypothetical protein
MTKAAEMETMDYLVEQMAAKGWSFSPAGDSIFARQSDWPAQLAAIIDVGGPGRDGMMGLVVDFRTMPLGGERFKDILNADRDETMGRFAPFQLRQLRTDGSWANPTAGSSFLAAFGPASGISRNANVAVFDRAGGSRGAELLEKFCRDHIKLVEAGGCISGLLQRVYQRTVLSGEIGIRELPSLVGDAPAHSNGHFTGLLPAVAGAVVAEPAYPWRR